VSPYLGYKMMNGRTDKRLIIKDVEGSDHCLIEVLSLLLLSSFSAVTVLRLHLLSVNLNFYTLKLHGLYLGLGKHGFDRRTVLILHHVSISNLWNVLSGVL
jgi:hypothetical protein